MTAVPAPTEATTDLHPLEYEGGVWTCPITGVQVPKPDRAHREWRGQILKLCANNKAAQEKMREFCKQSLPLFVNTFGWTYKFKSVDEQGYETGVDEAYVPFNTYPCQDAALHQLQEHIPKGANDRGGDVLIDKSREMGASWLLIATVAWMWLFHPNSRCKLTSRVEDLVDKTDDPDSLFWKLDAFVGKLPPWLWPAPIEQLQTGGKHRQHMQLTNPVNGATVSGEATTKHVGRGGRANLIAFDEMSAMQTAEAAWRSASSTTSCRIANSTPVGAGTKYSRLYFDGCKTGTPAVVGLYYHDHPEKGYGRKWMIDVDGEVTNEAGRGYWWTPWLEQERKRRDPQDMAQNVLADHVSAGSMFFSPRAITKHIQTHTATPVRCEIETFIAGNGMERARFVEAPDTGRWYVWAELSRKGRPVHQNTNFVIFADPSYGKGAANAAAAVMDRDRGAIVAEYVDPYTPPQDLAAQMALAGFHLFRGQMDGAFIGWEVNGPGEAMYQDMLRRDYPFIYFQRQTGQAGELASKRYGWHSTRSTKRILCGQLNRAMVREEILIPSHTGLNEMMEYVFYNDGSIGPSSVQDELSGAREAHGDRCFVAGTKVTTDQGERPIELIKTGERVLTRHGWKPVLASGMTSEAEDVWEVRLTNGRALIGTSSHPVWTENRGWVGLSSLGPRDMLNACDITPHTKKLTPSLSTVSGSTAGHGPNTNIFAATTGRTRAISATGFRRFIAKYGKPLTGRYRLDILSTTRTGTQPTTTLRICNALPHPSIHNSMELGRTSQTTSMSESILPPAHTVATHSKRGGARELGFAPVNVSSDITTHKTPRTPRLSHMNASSAANSGSLTSTMRDSAQELAKQNGMAPAAPTISSEYAMFAGLHSKPTNTAPVGHARDHAHRVYVASKHKHREQAPVYNLTVGGVHEYFAEGVLVHNCIAYAGCVMLREEAPHFEPEPSSYRPEQLGAIAEHWRIEQDDEDDQPFSDLAVGWN